MSKHRFRNEAARGATQDLAPTAAHMEDSRWSRIAANVKTIAGAVLLALAIRTMLFEAFEIEGPSMEPTLLNGDRVVVAKYVYGLFLPLREEAEVTWGAPDLGDAVIIKSPADGVDIVKRVIGLPGDVIEMRDEVVHRNGKPIETRELGSCKVGRGALQAHCRWRDNELNGRHFTTSSAGHIFDSTRMTVPREHVFVLGDHRDSSNDSRAIGPIPVNRIKGKALAIYWSSGDDGLRTARMFNSVR